MSDQTNLDTMAKEQQQLEQQPPSIPANDEVLEAVTPTTEANPYNATHLFGCKCPSCCKKAKLARGEPIKTRSDKKSTSTPSTPAPKPIDTKARAVKAATVRWERDAASHYDWEGSPLEAAQDHLAAMRKEIERGGRILQQRHSSAQQRFVKCTVCQKDIENGRWMQNRTIRNEATGLLESIYLCSQLCISKYSYSPVSNPPPSHGPTGLPKPELPQHVVQAGDKEQKAN